MITIYLNNNYNKLLRDSSEVDYLPKINELLMWSGTTEGGDDVESLKDV